MTDPAELDIVPIRARFWQRISVVWLVPVLALAVSLGVAWKNYADRGTLIVISFSNAAGIEAGQSVLKYRAVSVGLVEKVGFSADLSRVMVSVRVENNVVPFLDNDAHFWVVRPKVSVRGVTGLNTILSGAYIEGSWNRIPGTPKSSFIGIEEPPLVRLGQQGSRIVLRMRDGNQMSAGAPILHKGIEVGYVEAPRLSPMGDDVLVNAFVSAPYNLRLTSATRFWDTSGFSVNFGTGGVTIDVNNLASLVEGGVSFDTLVSGGKPIEDGHVFDVFEDDVAARSSVFDDPGAEMLALSVLFDGSVSGLTVGSAVRFRGIQVGEVTRIGAYVEEVRGRPKVRLLVNIALRAGRLGLPETAAPEDGIALIADYVTNGMRARLATASILTGAVVVDLVELPDATPMRLDMTGDPYPIIPSIAAEISDFNATAEGVFTRINALPIEELMTSAIDLLNSLDVVARDPAVRKTPAAALALLEDTRNIVNSEEIAKLPGDLRAAVNDIRALMQQLDEGQAIANLLGAIEKADAAMADIQIAASGLPEITRQIKDLGDKANSLAVEDLVASTTKLLASADAFIGTEDARRLPPALTSALEEITVFLGQVREGGAIENTNKAISAAGSAAEAVARAAEGLPELSERLTVMVRNAEDLLASYGQPSRVNTEILSTLRDIQDAAAAVSALARTIQRNPNSLITGR